MELHVFTLRCCSLAGLKHLYPRFVRVFIPYSFHMYSLYLQLYSRHRNEEFYIFFLH